MLFVSQDSCQSFGLKRKFFEKKGVGSLKAAWLKGFIFSAELFLL
jgi:hypothetical protein